MSSRSKCRRDSTRRPAGLLVGGVVEREEPVERQRGLVFLDQPQVSRRRCRRGQLPELEEPGVLVDAADPPASRTVSSAISRAAGRAPLTPPTHLAPLVQGAGEQQRGLVGHRQHEQGVRREWRGPHDHAHHRPLVLDDAEPERPVPGSGSPVASSRACFSATVATTVPTSGSAARWSPATRRNAPASVVRTSSMVGG